MSKSVCTTAETLTAGKPKKILNLLFSLGLVLNDFEKPSRMFCEMLPMFCIDCKYSRSIFALTVYTQTADNLLLMCLLLIYRRELSTCDNIYLNESKDKL